MMRSYIQVTAATIWTNPESPRKKDLPSIACPANIPQWLQNMSEEDKTWLIDNNAVQTQALYGSQVLITEQSGDWSHVFIPDQHTPKQKAGYPGWIPTCQLSFSTSYDEQYHVAPSVWVTVPQTPLYTPEGVLPASYLTRLPLSLSMANSMASKYRLKNYYPVTLSTSKTKTTLYIMLGSVLVTMSSCTLLIPKNL
jgi:hypothetical protein